MASQAHTTRRNIFAIAGAVALAPAVAFTSPATNGAHLLELERQLNALLVTSDRRDVSDDVIDAAVDAMVPIEVAIAAAPCDCREALLVKLRTVVRTGMTNGQLYAIDEETLLDGMIAFVAGRH